jgi:gluconokinase
MSPGDLKSVPLVVVMGVAGSGKTTVGIALAKRLGVDYGEADDFHPQRNIDKMSSGQALDDDDRRPWLDAIGDWLAAHHEAGAVATCSALKRDYRDRLRAAAPETVFLHLVGDKALLAQRMTGRKGHFMPTSLLASQLATLEPLEPDEAGIALDIRESADEIVSRFVSWWDSRANPAG